MKKKTHQTENSSLSTLSRRQFLQGTAATCLAASMLTACSGSDGGDDYFDSVGHDNVEPKEGTWHYSHCRMCMRGECSTEYMMVDGVVTEMKGNKESPYNKGAMCPRGNAAIQKLYNPYRVKAPMKRTNPLKGFDQDPGWVEITWEEAYATTAEKFAAARAKDPRSLMFQVGFGDMDYFESFLIYFPLASGSSWLESNGPLCTVHLASNYVHGAHPTANVDLSLAKYHITVGRSIGLGFATANGMSRGVINAITEDNVKIVDVNPRLTGEGTKGEWVPIKPGTDLAFLLAIAYEIIDNGVYDVDFLKWSTSAPYLIDTTTGQFYKVGDKPQMADAADGGTVKPFDVFDPNTATDPELFVTTTIDGKVIKSAFQMIKDNLDGTDRSSNAESNDAYTAEWAETITTIPADTIKRLARELVEYASPSGNFNETIDLDDGAGGVKTLALRPSSLIIERGAMNHKDGTQADFMSKVINQLIGALEIPGGVIGSKLGAQYAFEIGADPTTGVVAPKHEAVENAISPNPVDIELKNYFSFQHSMPYLGYKVIKDPETYGINDFKVEAMFLVGSNPIGSITDSDAIAEGFASIPFTASIAYHYDESAHFSDILLPSHSLLERESVSSPCDFSGYTKDTIDIRTAIYRDPVPPLYNTEQPQEITMEIADRIGILRGPGGINFFANMAGVMVGSVAMTPLVGTAHEADLGARYTIGELWDKGLKVMFAKDNIDREYLKKHGGLYYEHVPKGQVYLAAQYEKGETRFPIYFDYLQLRGEQLRTMLADKKAANDPVDIPGWGEAVQQDHLKYYEAMPTWKKNTLNDPANKGDGYFTAFNFKITESPFKMGAVDQMPWLNEIGDTFDPYYNTICMNPASAGGLRDGSIVTVESANGKIQGKLRLTHMVHPESVGIGGSTGRRVKTLGEKAASMHQYNLLTTGNLDSIDPLSGGVNNSVRVRVY